MSVYKRKSGRWQVRVSEVDSAGRRKRVNLGTFVRKADAEKAERDALIAREKSIPFAPSTMTLNELFERFIKDAEGRNLSPKTINEYRAKWSLYVSPRLGPLRVDRLRPITLSDFYAEIRTSGGRHRITKKPRPIAAPTVRHVADLISSVLKWAYRLELIARNVSDFVEPPKGEKKTRPSYQPSEAVRLVEEAAETRYGPLVVFAFMTGLRRGELAALRWRDVDLARKVAIIRGSIGQIKERVWYKEVKQGREKSIALSDEAIDALRRQRAQTEADRKAYGPAYLDEDFVFAKPEGGHANPNSIGQAVRRIARRAGLTVTALHSMRHSTGSWLIADGVDIQTVSAVLRHSSASTTLLIYAHELTGAQATAVAGIGKRLRGVKKQSEDVREAS
jgi:integrase